MGRRAFAAALVLAPLLCLGCSDSGGPPAGAEKPQAGPARSGGLPLLEPVAGTRPLVPSSASRFSFAVFGDNQGQPGSTTIKEIFRRIHDAQPPRPAFAFSLGDIVKGKDPEDPTGTLRRNFAEYLQIAKGAGVPVFNAPGNHEMDDGRDVPSPRMHELYEEVVAPHYGAFDYGNSRFIGLNTEDVPPKGTKPPEPPVEFSYISDAQLDQFDRDLAANKDKTHVFVMMHYPIKPKRREDALNPESREKLTAILEKYDNIAYVLASHEHLFHNPQDPDNVTDVAPFQAGDPTRYLVSGGAGAWLDKREGTRTEAFYHYLLFEVDGERILVTIHRMDE